MINGCYWGARIDGQFYVDNASGHWIAPTDNQDAPWSGPISGDGWDLFEAHAGKRISCVHWGGPGNTLPTSFDTTAEADARARGAFSLYTVSASASEMADLAANSNTNGVLTKVDTWATQLAGVHNPVMLRFCQEMNASWSSPFPWQTGGGTSAATYKAAFQVWSARVRAIASNVSIVWCPNVIDGSSAVDPTPWDPGHAHYDWLGIDGYVHSTYTSPSSLFDTTLNIMRGLAPGLPIVICETGCEAPTGSPGKAAWITDLLTNYIPGTSDIKCVVWFNETGNPVWPFIEVGDSSSTFGGAAQSAFSTAIASTFYLGAIVNMGTFPADASVPIPDSTTTGSVGSGVSSGVAGRVLIAFDDGPLVASPTWTRIDNTPNLVAKIDLTVGRQTLLAQTDTGTATVYLNDTTGLFDPRNSSSPYYNKLDGRQILIQLYNPFTATWESQFRGLIDDYGYVINPASDRNGNPILANIQIDCVDIFDYLAGYGLTPGLDGVKAPTGAAGTVYYAATSGTVDGRIIEVLTDTGIDPSRYVVFTGNVSLQESQYDADEAALQVLRDCADAEIPFIANIYPDRNGRFCFHGRESRFTPDTVAASAGTAAWDFHRWKVGDGAAVLSDATRTQIRVLEYSRARSNIINAAVCYPKGIAQTDISGQVYADATSISSYGKHTPPGGAIQELQISEGTTTGNSGKVECGLYAELLVKNQKDPREAITALQLKTVTTSDSRASAVWDMITKADISDIVNAKAGYPGGTGFTGGSTVDDYYVEGRSMRIEPATAIEAGGYDYVELDLNVSPAVWSMDTHAVF